MDEQWGYVGAKSRKRWLFYAYDRIRRTVVAHVFGERTLATLERLLSLLSAFEVVVWMTDGWPLYESRLKGELHVISKRYTQRIERTLFILDWLQSVELRRRVQAGLNKGEARNALARAVFFNRLGEIRDRSFEQQRYRASGLNLVTAAIVLWNTAYLERATNALNGHGKPVDETLFQYLSPLGWEHINLTGDYLWRSSAKIGAGKFRPLRPLSPT